MKARTAKLVLVAVAPLTLAGAVTLTGGVASAARAPAAKAPATISCKSLTATISWNPALVPGTATSPTTQITLKDPKVSGCTTTPKSSVTTATSVKATASLTTHGNSCRSLLVSTGTPTTYTFKITWKGGGKSTVTFQGSGTTTKPKPGFTLKDGKATGAYPSTKASANAYLSSISAAAITGCIADSGPPVSSVSVTSGTFSA